MRSIAANVFPNGGSEVDWERAVARVEEGDDFCIVRVSGGFDDREAGFDAFLRDEQEARNVRGWLAAHTPAKGG